MNIDIVLYYNKKEETLHKICMFDNDNVNFLDIYTSVLSKTMITNKMISFERFSDFMLSGKCEIKNKIVDCILFLI